MIDERICHREALSCHPVEVGYRLIGHILRVERDGVVTAGRIVECEAYAGPLDAASHTARLKVARDVMARQPGTIYTYLSYGLHSMMNIVAHLPGESGAVLIRAVEPLEGIEIMRERRGGVPDARLAKGPGNVTSAMGIVLADIGDDLMTSGVLSLHAGQHNGAVHSGPRVGITKAVKAPWRFFEAGNPHVSSHRKGTPLSIDDLLVSIPPPGTPVE